MNPEAMIEALIEELDKMELDSSNECMIATEIIWHNDNFIECKFEKSGNNIDEIYTTPNGWEVSLKRLKFWCPELYQKILDIDYNYLDWE